MKTSFMNFVTVFLCGIFFLCGCGSEEIEESEDIVTPMEEKKIPNYFPDAVGNRWVYRHSDGFEWEREVARERIIQGRVYRVFDYMPPIEDTIFDYLKTPSYRVTPNRVLFFVGEEINRYFETGLAEGLENEVFLGANVEVKVNAISEHELVFFRIPPITNVRWDVLNLKVKGNIIFLDLNRLQLPFEIRFLIKGAIVGGGAVETPAGIFETTAKIEYNVQVTTSIFEIEETTTEETDTIWLAPEVGIVKIEKEDGTTELIEYSLVE